MNEPWISFPTNSVVNSYIEEGFRAHGLELPKPSINSFSMQVRLHLLETGRFLTILHDSVLWFNAKHWSLKALPIDLLVRPMPIVIFTLKNRTASPVVQLFIDQAHETAKSFLSTPMRRIATSKI
jgi:DNA-binding transcriptional LysR family regulator